MKIKNKNTGFIFEADYEDCIQQHIQYPNDLELIPESKQEQEIIKKEEKKVKSVEERLLGN